MYEDDLDISTALNTFMNDNTLSIKSSISPFVISSALSIKLFTILFEFVFAQYDLGNLFILAFKSSTYCITLHGLYTFVSSNIYPLNHFFIVSYLCCIL